MLLVAAFFFDVHVAKTLGKGLVELNAVNEYVIMSGLIGAIVWNIITWYFGLPTSSSHALIGGLIGAVVAVPLVGGLGGRPVGALALAWAELAWALSWKNPPESGERIERTAHRAIERWHGPHPKSSQAGVRSTMKVKPLHDRILVKRIEEGEQVVGGIIIPDTAKEKPQQGKVVAIDLLEMPEVPGVDFAQLDFLDPSAPAKLPISASCRSLPRPPSI